MAKFNMSLSARKSRYTSVENSFITDYMPQADGEYVKVYITGLHACGSGDTNISEALSMSAAAVTTAYEYWQERGIVKIICKNPLVVEYADIDESSAIISRKFKPSKYADFNKSLQEIFAERIITPAEYVRYYECMEDYRIEPEALLLIAQYCIKLKGAGIRYPYVIAVAADWAREGVRTILDCDVKLQQMEANGENMRAVLFALGRKGSADMEEMQTLLKWQNSWGYSMEAILRAAENLKGRGGIRKLDGLLDGYYRMGILTAKDIEEKSQYLKRTRKLTLEINRILGLYYESTDYLIEQYISPWLDKGYDEETLIMLAKHAAKRGIRSYEGFNNVVNGLYVKGLITQTALQEHFAGLIERDAAISKVIEKTGSSRTVTAADREYYRVWTSEWGFSEEMILFAAALAEGKAHSPAYINNLLSRWREAKVFTKAAAEAFMKKPVEKTTVGREYSKEELNSVFVDISELEV